MRSEGGAEARAAGFVPERVVEAIRSALGTPGLPVALHEPDLSGREWAYVKETLDSGWVSSAGDFVERFERMIAETAEARFAVATVNGTAALHMCLHLLGVARDDEVVVPAMTFVSTANAVAHLGAIPHFADASADTLGLDAARLDTHLGEIGEMRDGALVNRLTGRRIAAVVSMHTFGQPVDLDALIEVSARHSVALMEDAAESLGTTYKSRHTGAIARIGAFSFNGNKIVTTGGGGAVVTNEEALGRAAKHLTTTAKLSHPWEYLHDAIGYNYRLPNINAALGVAQLERLEEFVAAKRRLAGRYLDAFAGVPGVAVFTERAFSRSNYWLNTLILDRGLEAARDEVLRATHEAGFLTRPAWQLMHLLPMYADCPRMELPVSESLAERIVNLPSSANLAPAEGAARG